MLAQRAQWKIDQPPSLKRYRVRIERVSVSGRIDRNTRISRMALVVGFTTQHGLKKLPHNSPNHLHVLDW